MKQSKKRVSLLLTGAMIFAQTPMTPLYATEYNATAEESVTPIVIQSMEYDSLRTSSTWRNPNVSLHSSNELEQVLLTGLINCEKEIDLSSLNIPYTQEDFDDLQELFYELIANNSALFHVTSVGTPDLIGSIMNKLPINYDSELSDNYSYYNNLITAEIATIVEATNQGSTNLEKMLILSDYLAVNYEYDESLQISDIARFVDQKTGVCQSYTDFAKLILNELGIPNVTISSDSLWHIWNQVEYKDEWYNIDFTWNDPVADLAGRATHTNFMISNDTKHSLNNVSGYSAGYYDDWRYKAESATDTTYENRFTESNVESPFLQMCDEYATPIHIKFLKNSV